MGRGLLIVLLATPVCAAVATMVGLASADVLLTGEPFTWRDAAQALIFFFGPLLVVGYSIYATTRSTTSRPLLASMLVIGGLAGVGFGGWFGWGIVHNKHAFTASRVAEACSWVDVPECETRAIECIHSVDGTPIVVARGMGNADDQEDLPGVPRTPKARAIYRCLNRP